MSKGEEKIAELLRQNKVEFQQEVSFKGLKGSKFLLRYDFGIFKKGKLIALIEYDGEQHFIYNSLFYKSARQFRKQKEHDIKKNKFCLQRNIPLIRVPYWKLDELTFTKLFQDKTMRVQEYNHNIKLIDQRVKK